MDIRTESFKRCELIFVSGQVDTATAPELEQALLSLVQSGKRNLVVSLRDVSFISSAGLRALITAQIKVRRMLPRGEVVISEASPWLRETFELVGFHHLFKFYEGDVEAVASF